MRSEGRHGMCHSADLDRDDEVALVPEEVLSVDGHNPGLVRLRHISKYHIHHGCTRRDTEHGWGELYYTNCVVFIFTTRYRCCVCMLISVPDSTNPARIAFSIAPGKEGSGRYSAHS